MHFPLHPLSMSRSIAIETNALAQCCVSIYQRPVVHMILQHGYILYMWTVQYSSFTSAAKLASGQYFNHNGQTPTAINDEETVQEFAVTMGSKQ